MGERARFVVITNDLDFSAILAGSSGATPSVVQIRTHDLLSERAVGIVANALEAHLEDIERGALPPKLQMMLVASPRNQPAA